MWSRMMKWSKNNEQENMWKKAGVTFDVLFRLFYGWNEENDKNLRSTGQYLKVGLPEKKIVIVLEHDMQLRIS
jgi:hypothetical protein